MQLNYKNAAAAGLLPSNFSEKPNTPYPILHFGVGGFHRSHQAWALQQLINRQPNDFGDWGITGVGILPHDAAFAKALCNQECLYFVQRFSPGGERKTELVSAIREMLHVAEDYETILTRIASPQTRVISFTITEGGYNVDYSNNSFIWDTPAVQSDLQKVGVPKTVFRVLAEGLKKRMTENAAPVVLMSCDNVQHNGDILRLALLEFLKKFDPSLIGWVQQHVAFVKSMVDRITPVTTARQKEEFSKTSGFNDDCLVVCEDFFQWIVQKDPALAGLPLEQMGAMLVADVEPYEKMKLRLLNGGHSLTGLLGYAMGYNYIHEAIMDEAINEVYRRYCAAEVIPTLDTLPDTSYADYVHQLVSRFSNPMINDAVTRIILGSGDKLPKFVLPVISDQLKTGQGDIQYGVFILAAWYYYLQKEFDKNEMADVQDMYRDLLRSLFSEPSWQPAQFFERLPMLRPLRNDTQVKDLFLKYVDDLQSGDMRSLLSKLLQNDEKNEK